MSKRPRGQGPRGFRGPSYPIVLDEKVTKTFLGLVETKGDDECWPWVGVIDAKGYGRLFVGSRSVIASRISWTHFRGTIPPGLCVLHKCDNPPCVNPSHLFVGTMKDNCVDRAQKKRGNSQKGSRHVRAKVCEADVLRMRQLKAEGMFYRELAAMYGMSKTAVREAVLGQTWKHMEKNHAA